MKKIFTLFAAALMAGSMMADVKQIRFTEAADQGTLDDEVFGVSFSLSVRDDNEDETKRKIAIDKNSCKFGLTADSIISFEYRLKTGASSGEHNSLNLNIPQDGKLTIYARTGSNSATNRNILINDRNSATPILDHICLEADTVVGASTRIYLPIVIDSMKAGQYTLQYPNGSINFYGFDLEVADAPTATPSVEEFSSLADLAGLALTFVDPLVLASDPDGVFLANADMTSVYGYAIFEDNCSFSKNVLTIDSFDFDDMWMAPLPEEEQDVVIYCSEIFENFFELFPCTLHFVPGEPTALENNAAAVKAQKVIKNGQVVILRDGKRFNLVGAEL